MGFLDDAKKKLTEAVDKHGSKIDAGIDKAADMADRKTKGKYRGQIRSGAGKAKDVLEKLDEPNKRDRPRGTDTPPPPPPPRSPSE